MAMNNLFDSTNAPTTEPAEFVVGDFGQWKRPDLSATYPPSDYTLTYVARESSGNASEIKVIASNSNGVHLFTVTSAESESYSAGHYHWQLEVQQISSGNRAVIQRGEVDIIVDLDVNNVDARSHAEIMIQKIESLLEGKADDDVASYTIAGRSLNKMTFEELTQARDHYKRELVRQINASKMKNGKNTNTTIKVTF